MGSKIHFAQKTGINVLFIKYTDDNIEEVEVDQSSFQGAHIPVFMLKHSDVEKIMDVINS